MKLIYLKSALKCNSFDVAIGTKILFFRVLVTIELGRSILQFVTTNCLICVCIIFIFLNSSPILICRALDFDLIIHFDFCLFNSHLFFNNYLIYINFIK